MAVAVQGYMALDLIRKNNLELIKGVDRAQTTTVAALRTAVIVSQALSRQKLVLDQITALNATTSTLIESTSNQLRIQGAEINQQAASSTIDVQKLQDGLRQRLPDDGRDRHVPRPGRRQHGADGRRRSRARSSGPSHTSSAPAAATAATGRDPGQPGRGASGRSRYWGHDLVVPARRTMRTRRREPEHR